MKKQTITRWAARQYAGDVQPWPLWLRWSLAVGFAVVILLKLAGVF